MSTFEVEHAKVASWLLPLDDASAPCGPDLEYDNDFLALNVAAAGKPESTFGAAEPPDWRAVVEMAESLLDRSRDLRVAVLWLRGQLHQAGYGALPVGLTLINGLIEQLWDTLHPLPDPDDGDPYARVNALTLLRENEGLIGDLWASQLVRDRAIGSLTVRQVLAALGQLPATEGDPSRDQATAMLAGAAKRLPLLRTQCTDAVALARRLISLASDRLGSETAPDLRPLYNLAHAVAGLLPAAASDDDGADAGADADDAEGDSGDTGAGGGGSRRSLSGSVNSREDAVRAIDLVCAYLERAEPANPASLFLRRGQQLIGQNFLQLIKALAPEALAGVAGMVGVDPSSLDEPASGYDGD